MDPKNNFDNLTSSRAGSLPLECFDQTEGTCDIPKVDWNELQDGCQLLGQGAFANVFLVFYDTANTSSPQVMDRFALKCLDSEKLKTPEEFSIAADNQASEARLLCKLNHRNIIRIRGLPPGRFSDYYDAGGKGYFILLDVLEETLKDRIKRWRKDPQLCSGRRNSVTLAQVFRRGSISKNTNASIKAMRRSSLSETVKAVRRSSLNMFGKS